MLFYLDVFHGRWHDDYMSKVTKTKLESGLYEFRVDQSAGPSIRAERMKGGWRVTAFTGEGRAEIGHVKKLSQIETIVKNVFEK